LRKQLLQPNLQGHIPKGWILMNPSFLYAGNILGDDLDKEKKKEYNDKVIY
jgi:hypothetical protein